MPAPITHATRAATFVANEPRAHWHDGALWFVRGHRDAAARAGPDWEALREAAAGLKRRKEGAPADDPLVRAHLRPQPPLAAGRQAARLEVPCAIDVSDGLLQDLHHICDLCELGAVVRADAVPLSQQLRSAFTAEEALALACGGGEDYQLVLIAPQETMRLLRASAQVRVTVIGEMDEHPEQRPRLMDASGVEIKLPEAGWDHLRA